VLPTSWHVQGTGDFNGDGTSGWHVQNHNFDLI